MVWRKVILVSLVTLGTLFLGSSIQTQEKRLNLWEQKLEVVGSPRTIERATAYDGMFIEADAESVLYVVDLRVQFLSSGKFIVSNQDFSVTDPTHPTLWTDLCEGINISGEANSWSLPNEGGSVTIEKHFDRGDKQTLNLLFCATKKFKWQKAELRLAVPIRALKPAR